MMLPKDLSTTGSRWLAIAMACLLAIPPGSGGQVPAAQKLVISILEGEGAVNNIRQRTSRELIVQVEDENDRPIAGAVVIFTLPDRGASGTFANGTRSVTVTTDARGRAVARGFRPNDVGGDVDVQVTASFQGMTGSIVIRQSNVQGAGGGLGAGKAVAIIGVVGGAAAAGAIYATRRDRGTTPTPTPPPTPATTISAGNPSVGAP